MISCPICSFQTKTIKGLSIHFRHQSDTHPDYKIWKQSQEPSKIDGVDYIVCQICQTSHQTLRGHLSKHGIKSKEYLKLYPTAPLHSSKNYEKQSAVVIITSKTCDRSGSKTIVCPDCNKKHLVSKYFVPNFHNSTCEDCKTEKFKQSQVFVKISGIEGIDYVTCKICGWVAENLTSHIVSEHNIKEYRQNYPHASMTSLNAGNRDKTKVIGRKNTPETIQKMKNSAGWNRGLTSQTDVRVHNMTEGIRKGFQNGRITWSKGLTSEQHESLKKTSENLKKWYKENAITWSNGLKVTLTEADLDPFKLKNGKISIFKACLFLKYSYPTIRKECERLNLPIFRRGISQGYCLEAVSKCLKIPYMEEWKTLRFVHPETNRPFRFDGYFPDVGLIVEYHGYQHFVYPNAYHKNRQQFEDQILRDAMKRKCIENDPNLKYLEIKYDDPFTDLDWLRKRLQELNIPS